MLHNVTHAHALAHTHTQAHTHTKKTTRASARAPAAQMKALMKHIIYIYGKVASSAPMSGLYGHCMGLNRPELGTSWDFHPVDTSTVLQSGDHELVPWILWKSVTFIITESPQ